MKSEIKIRDEENLLSELCRLEFSDENLKKIKSLTAAVNDWDYFRNLANIHGVSALVYHNLEKHNLLSGIPGEVIAYLRGALMISLSRNTINTEAMGTLLRLLNNENIKAVILKGLALENTIYGNAGVRQMSDVDILITREECMRAREILLNIGYISLPVKSFLHELIMIDLGKHLPSLIKNGTSVEIHHELFAGRNNALTRMLYDSSYEGEITGEKTWFPQPQLHFLYLVKHLSIHEMNNESQLRLYTDLIVLIEKHYNEILNFNLIKYATESGMSESLASYLGILRDVWGVSFPGWIIDFIGKWQNSHTADKFRFFLRSPKDNPAANKSGFYRHIINDIPGFHSKFLFVLGDLFPSFRFMKKRYSCKSNWKVLLYYPHRLGKLMWLFRK